MHARDSSPSQLAFVCVHTFLFTNTLRAQSDRPPWSNAEVWHERGRWPLGSYMTSIVGLWSSHALAIRTRGTHSPRTQMRGRGITCPEFIQHGRRAHQHSFNLPCSRGLHRQGVLAITWATACTSTTTSCVHWWSHWCQRRRPGTLTQPALGPDPKPVFRL